MLVIRRCKDDSSLPPSHLLLLRILLLPMTWQSLFEVDFMMRWVQDTQLILRLQRVSLASSLRYLRMPGFQGSYGKERPFQRQVMKRKAENPLIEIILSKGSFLWRLPLICLALWIRASETGRMWI